MNNALEVDQLDKFLAFASNVNQSNILSKEENEETMQNFIESFTSECLF